MAIVETTPQRLTGPWIEGYVLDRHVISSVPIGYYGPHMQFDTTRSALGEVVFQLKNRSGSAADVIDTASAFAARWRGQVDGIVVPPPSILRRVQPAQVIAAGVATSLGVLVLEDAVIKALRTPAMKNTAPPDRANLLAQAIERGPASVQGRHVLIVDDLWQTGATVRRVAAILIAGGAASVRVLVMTRTR